MPRSRSEGRFSTLKRREGTACISGWWLPSEISDFISSDGERCAKIAQAKGEGYGVM